MSNIKLQFKKALDLIKSSDKIFLTMHEGPDGDDLGSLLAMRHFLKQIKKHSVAVVKEEIPDSLKFLPGSEDVDQKFPSEFDFDLVIFFGCNKIERTGFRQLQNIKLSMINFDHHPDNGNFGTVNVVDPDSGSNLFFITPSLWISSKKLIIQAGVSFVPVQHFFGCQDKIEIGGLFSIGWKFN